jgi:hypothetical protein
MKETAQRALLICGGNKYQAADIAFKWESGELQDSSREIPVIHQFTPSNFLSPLLFGFNKVCPSETDNQSKPNNLMLKASHGLKSNISPLLSFVDIKL